MSEFEEIMELLDDLSIDLVEFQYMNLLEELRIEIQSRQETIAEEQDKR